MQQHCLFFPWTFHELTLLAIKNATLETFIALAQNLQDGETTVESVCNSKYISKSSDIYYYYELL